MCFIMEEEKDKKKIELKKTTQSFSTKKRFHTKPVQTFKRIFFENIRIKLIAVVATIILFYLVKQEKDKEVEVDIPVTISNVEKDMVFVGKAPTSLRVRVRGRWSKIIRVIESKPVPYNIDLQGYQDGTIYLFDKEKIQRLIGSVQGIQILSIFPGDFIIRKEEKIKKTTPVKVSIVGEPKKGYEVDLKNIKWSPNSIDIEGAKSSFQDINLIWTQPIDVNGIDKDMRLEIGLQLPAKNLLIGDVKVKVEIPIVPRIGEKIIADVKVEIKNCPNNLYCYVDPEKMSVRVKGPEPFLFQLSEENINNYVYVDANIHEISEKSKKIFMIPPNVKEMEKTTWSVMPKKFKLMILQEEKKPIDREEE